MSRDQHNAGLLVRLRGPSVRPRLSACPTGRPSAPRRRRDAPTTTQAKARVGRSSTPLATEIVGASARKPEALAQRPLHAHLCRASRAHLRIVLHRRQAEGCSPGHGLRWSRAVRQCLACGVARLGPKLRSSCERQSHSREVKSENKEKHKEESGRFRTAHRNETGRKRAVWSDGTTARAVQHGSSLPSPSSSRSSPPFPPFRLAWLAFECVSHSSGLSLQKKRITSALLPVRPFHLRFQPAKCDKDRCYTLNAAITAGKPMYDPPPPPSAPFLRYR